jgi:hypothetical protein
VFICNIHHRENTAENSVKYTLCQQCHVKGKQREQWNNYEQKQNTQPPCFTQLEQEQTQKHLFTYWLFKVECQKSQFTWQQHF